MKEAEIESREMINQDLIEALDEIKQALTSLFRLGVAWIILWMIFD